MPVKTRTLDEFKFRGDTVDKPVSNLDKDMSFPEMWELTRDLVAGMRDISERGEYTSDYPLLSKKKSQLVFVYGTLKKSFRNHRTLGSDAKIEGVGFTKFNRFFLANYTKGGFPVAFFNNSGVEASKAKIYGEVYSIHPDVMLDLDYLESNGIMFKRINLPVTVTQGDGSTQDTYAWTYIGVKDYWSSHQASLEPARLMKPNNGTDPYYIFTLNDEH
jgi:gamma-glutamylcyclotransferase (GGCT)/AIG2-like uncharacterized protein YtfP